SSASPSSMRPGCVSSLPARHRPMAEAARDDTDTESAMTPVNSRPPELALPVASLAALRRELAAAAGGDAAARALQSAGNAAGEAFFRALAHGLAVPGDEDAEAAARNALAALDQATFWRRFSELFANRGWGHLGMVPVHPGVGALDSTDWVEVD